MFKNISFLCALCFLASCASPQEKPDISSVKVEITDSVPPQKAAIISTRYKTGDKLTAFALAGLTLRDKPDKKGAKLGTIPMGASVTILPDDMFKMPYEVIEKNNIKLKGFWVKVRSDTKEGYVFDGFLSHLTAPGKQEVSVYLAKWSKQVSSNKTPPPRKDDRDANIFVYELTKFENGTSYEMRAYEGGATTQVRIPTILATFEEAYTLGKAFFPPANDATDEYTALEIKQEGSDFIIQFAVAD